MVQIIKDPGRWSSFGSSVGRSLGEGLQALAAQKLNDMRNRQALEQKQNMFSNLGYTSADASVLSSLPENLQLAYMTEFTPPGIPQMQANTQLEQAMGALQMKKQPTIAQQPVAVPEATPVISKPVMAPPLRMTTTQRLKAEQMDRKREIEDRRLKSKIAKEERVHQYHVDKETKEVYKAINDEAESAYQADRRISRMETLVGKGDLTRPRWHAILKTISQGVMGHGINLHSLESPDSQEFLKLSQEFLKDAKKIFGARVTNMEIENLLKMIPSLSQSREGKLRVINNMRLYNEGSLIKKKAMDDIISENNGKRPMNLKALVDKRTKKDLDIVAKKVIEGYKPQQQLRKSPGILETLMEQVPNPMDIILGKG